MRQYKLQLWVDHFLVIYYSTKITIKYIPLIQVMIVSVINTETDPLDTTIDTTIEARDGNGDTVERGSFIQDSNSITFDIETILELDDTDGDTEGIICTLNGEPYEECLNLYSDNPTDNQPDRKACTIDNEENEEICTMTLTIPNLSKRYYEFTVAAYQGEYNPPEEPIITLRDEPPATFSWFIGERLETAILDVRDGNNEIINSGHAINTNSIFMDMEIRNINDIEGVICFLNGVQCDECDRFDDPINDEKQYREIVVNERTHEICTFTIKINNLEPDNYDFSVAAFYVAALNQIEDEKFTYNLAISTREETSDQSKYDQSTNEMPLINFTQFFDLQFDNTESQSNLSSPIELSLVLLYPNIINSVFYLKTKIFKSLK